MRLQSDQPPVCVDRGDPDQLRAARELVGLIKALPETQQDAALEKARATVRANRQEADPVKASDMLRDLVKQSSFLKTITPKYTARQGSSAGIFVLRDGELVEGRAIKESRVSDGSLDLNEARARQKELVRRQHFGNLPGKKEFW
ncbi:hypothetical protein WJX84_004707 [Apatococcus fuscideae]|uniref:Uncharacterized protein n=1 Tax=Apatococcus fuscideae TaxID=2026836 RepID=A0AAW1T6F5_9CHLO